MAKRNSHGSKDDRFQTSQSKDSRKTSQSAKRKGKTKRDYSDPKDRETRGSHLEAREYSNDPGWYTRSGLLTRNASNISTYLPIGDMMSNTILQRDFTPAGIARYDYMPCFGDVSGPTHSINYVARLLYTVVNSKNSRNDRYDPSDLMTYVLGVANAWVLHSVVLRMIGMFNTYSVLNRYWWQDVMRTMGFSPIDATNDINHWVTLANKMALALNTLPVPKGITYFDRCQMLPSTVYVDSPVEKASFYYFMPARLFKFTYDDEGKGMLESVATPFANHTYSNASITPVELEAFFNSLTSDLLNDSDIRYMGADIYKAYDGDLYKIPQIDVKFTQSFVYDPMMNLQLRNATVHDYLRDGMQEKSGQHYTISQDMAHNCLWSTPMSGYLPTAKSSPSIMYHSFAASDAIFDFPTMEVSQEMFIEATKLHAFWRNGGTFVSTSEVILMDRLYGYVPGSDNRPVMAEVPRASVVGFPKDVPMSAANLAPMLNKIEFASKMAASPLQYLAVASGGTADAPIYSPPQRITLNDDLTNYTNVPTELLYEQAVGSQTSLFAPFDLN